MLRGEDGRCSCGGWALQLRLPFRCRKSLSGSGLLLLLQTEAGGGCKPAPPGRAPTAASHAAMLFGRSRCTPLPSNHPPPGRASGRNGRANAGRAANGSAAARLQRTANSPMWYLASISRALLLCPISSKSWVASLPGESEGGDVFSAGSSFAQGGRPSLGQKPPRSHLTK
jgi:hypothetical protein